MDVTRENQYRRIATLTARAKEYKENLQNKYDLAERILKLIGTINKLESLMEMQNEVDGDGGAQSGACIDEIKSTGLDLLQVVENRHSRAVELLEDQDQRLREAKQMNKRLKAKLKRYEDGTSLNNDVLMADGGNPLFVINGRLGVKG